MQQCKTIRVWSGLFALFLLLVGCVPASSTAVLEPSHEELSRLLSAPGGSLSGKAWEPQAARQEVRAWKKDATPEETWDWILGLVAEDYQPLAQKYERFDPTLIIDDPDLGPVPVRPGHYQMNVEVILDVSGSMAATIGGKRKIDLAKQAVIQFLNQLPDQANVAIRVYGHEGKSVMADKARSCSSSELVYPLKPFDREQMEQVIASFEPSGWSPIAASLRAAKKDLEPYPKTENLNVLYLVSDGFETCDGDPVETVRELRQTEMKPMVNIIGFDVDNEGQKRLKEVAVAGGGEFLSAKDEESLEKEFQKMLKNWKEIGRSG